VTGKGVGGGGRGFKALGGGGGGGVNTRCHQQCWQSLCQAGSNTDLCDVMLSMLAMVTCR
jgi:hypothetical protein